MILTRTVAPAAEVVTLTEMKAHLRIDHTDEDSLLQAYIDAAIDLVDGKSLLGRAMITQTWRQDLASAARDVVLGMTPVQALTSVKYYDSANALQTATLSDFELYTADDWAFVRSDLWPSDVYDRPDAIQITFTAGYGAAATDVPAAIRMAVKLIAARYFESRGDVAFGQVSKLPFGVDGLLNAYRLAWVGG